MGFILFKTKVAREILRYWKRVMIQNSGLKEKVLISSRVKPSWWPGWVLYKNPSSLRRHGTFLPTRYFLYWPFQRYVQLWLLYLVALVAISHYCSHFEEFLNRWKWKGRILLSWPICLLFAKRSYVGLKMASWDPILRNYTQLHEVSYELSMYPSLLIMSPRIV